MSHIPHLIAICGHPGSGKSEVQKILTRFYDVIQVDDGEPLRHIAMKHLGLSWDDVYTQPGKAKSVQILGKTWQNRKILGDMGQKFEEMFGPDIFAYMATKNLDPKLSYSFGSVRREQGQFYKDHGGIVIGVRNPHVAPSPHKFDYFNEDLVDLWIDNDFDEGAKRHIAWSTMRLEDKVHEMIEQIDRLDNVAKPMTGILPLLTPEQRAVVLNEDALAIDHRRLGF